MVGKAMPVPLLTMLAMAFIFIVARDVAADTCADNMIYMDLCTQWKSMCQSSKFLQEKCPKTCNVCKPVDCAWGDWGNFTQCSQTCGGGFHTRSRIVKTTPQYGGEACPGDAFESATCNAQACPVDCEWDEYGDWSICSKSCGGGNEYRERKVKTAAKNGGKNCTGQPREEKKCNVHNCAVNCEFEAWGQLTTCTKTCGGGTQFRTRGVKVAAAFGGEGCKGDSKEEQSCNTQACPVNCEWDVWSKWDKCSLTCGGGMTTRTRNIKTYPQFGGTMCQGQAAEMKICNNQTCPKDCKWGPYGEFTPCSKSCGAGLKTRSRPVAIIADQGGEACIGTPAQTISCNLRPCGIDCKWGDFGKWDKCSKSCGGGEQTRSRKVARKEAFGGTPCVGSAEEKRTCNAQACPVPVDCKWGDWGNWTQCTTTCGNGNQIRNRVVAQQAQNGGKQCDGTNTDFRPCNEFPCPVDCEWNDFGTWSNCDKDCGGGTHSHTRTVFKEAQFGGKPCNGKAVEERPCNETPCPINCLWDTFGAWSNCTEACDGGTQTRVRAVKQKAAYGGQTCSGYATESKNCNEQPCEVDCEWSPFGTWTPCSQSCGGGEETRSRLSSQAARNGGKACAGLSTERRTCNVQACPVDCKWSAYSEWTPCSQNCGGGYQMRTRKIQVHAANGGKDCPGCATDSRACNLQPCARNCKWAPWGPWATCTATCDGGTQNRTRTVLQAAANGGQDCTGETAAFRDCNTQKCPIDCKWAPWSKWDTCTKTCGGGMHGRGRTVLQKERYGGKPCTGDPQEMKGCNMQPCPICKDSPRYARFCPTWTAYCSNSEFVKGCCRKSCRLC